MTAAPVATVEGAPGTAELARDLVAGLVAAPWGEVSASVYETGRLVSLVPWLTGHEPRVAFLRERQRADGGWGAVPDDGYALVPTLSATEALMTVGDGAAEAGLRYLARVLPTLASRPDMPAIELISPYLIGRINRRLDERSAAYRLPLPPGMDGEKLARVEQILRAGTEIPQKFLHALEAAGDTARGLPQVRPEATGTVGASPAATAAWLGGRPPSNPSSPARWHLETVSARHGGPVPVGYPLTVFERGWVLAWLLRAGIPVGVPPELVLSLTAPLGPAGLPAAAGLPADADTTAGALYALSLLGAPHPPDPLWEYETPTHFSTWTGEDGASITTNTHVLEAFGSYLARGATSRYAATTAKVAGWLREQQAPDGSWHDRWHASPYYATASCAIALDRFGGPESAGAVGRARRWVLDTQRPDGSWGRWRGTSEETAYAVQLLLLTGPDGGEELQVALRGTDFLERSLARPDPERDSVPLWHDKDLYHPTAIVRAAVVAALHLGRNAAGISGEVKSATSQSKGKNAG